MGLFKRNKTPKKVKLCHELDHDWIEIGKCKDALGNHPCDYFPEGCNTCLTRFECYTKDSDTYRTRLTGVFYSQILWTVELTSSWEWTKHYGRSLLTCGKRDDYTEMSAEHRG